MFIGCRFGEIFCLLLLFAGIIGLKIEKVRILTDNANLGEIAFQFVSKPPYALYIVVRNDNQFDILYLIHILAV